MAAATFPDPGTTLDDPGTGEGGDGGVDEGAVQALIDASLPVAATTTTAGIVELATTGETTTGTDATRAVTPAGVAAAIAALVNSAPGLLDTLGEIAAALQADESTAAALATTVAGKQPLDSDLTAIAALTTTSYGRALLALADQAALTAAIAAATTSASGIVELATSGETTTGTDTVRATTPAGVKAVSDLLQPLDADLTAIAALTSAADKLPYSTGAQAWSLATFTAAGRALVDDADAAAQRTTLGLQHSIPSPDDTVTGEVVLGAAAMAALISGATTVAGRVYFVVGA